MTISSAKYTPEEIYYKILFELFNADLDLEASIEHRQDMSLLQTSVIWKTLFNYQQKGVISLIKMLRKYNGAILADAVGLGKTFSALAVMKYFQTQGFTTVLLCPKSLSRTGSNTVGAMVPVSRAMSLTILSASILTFRMNVLNIAMMMLAFLGYNAKRKY